MHTIACLTKTTGLITGQTTFRSTNDAFGFHGAVYAVCTAANGMRLGDVY
jgi:hypothetical protein